MENIKAPYFTMFLLPEHRQKSQTMAPHWRLCQAIMTHLDPSWSYVGPSWDYAWSYVGPSWSYVGPSLELCWPILGLCWPILGLCWPIFGLCWPVLGPIQHLIACRNRAQTYLEKVSNVPSELLEKIYFLLLLCCCCCFCFCCFATI